MESSRRRFIYHKKEEERDVTRVLVSLLCKGEVVYMYIWFINLLKPTDSPCFECDIFFVLFISLSFPVALSSVLGWSCQKAAAAATFCGGVWPKNHEKKSKSSLFRAFDETGDTKKLSSVVRGNLFFPIISVINISPRVVCEEDKDKEEDKKKRSTPSLRVTLF